jgi:hemerythrin superfamily protein
MTAIYSLLKQDHEKHKDLLARLQKASTTQEKEELWQRFYYDVKGHAAAEEETFYAELMSFSEGQPKARHSVSEHKELDDLLEEMGELKVTDAQWESKFKTLKHDYEHHIDEEETEIFPQAKKVLSQPLADQLGERFEARKTAEVKLAAEKEKAKLAV